ncbi:MAG: hypothetical protein V1800_05140 [Candidatus Latescibacterota bacterium]
MESLIVYFVLFLVISSLVKRLSRAQRKTDGETEFPEQMPSEGGAYAPVPSPVQPLPAFYPPSASEARAEGLPFPSQTQHGERVARRISLAERIREEIERTTGEGMKEQIEVSRPALPKPIQQKTKMPVRETMQKKSELVPPAIPRNKAVPHLPFALRFDPRSVRQGIIFSEILGPPRAEKF